MTCLAKRVYAVLALLVQLTVGWLLLPLFLVLRVPVFRYDLAWEEFHDRWRLAPVRIVRSPRARPLRKPVFLLVLEISVLAVCFPMLVLICGCVQVIGQFEDAVWDYRARRAGRLR